jgi:hypothetical protein
MLFGSRWIDRLDRTVRGALCSGAEVSRMARCVGQHKKAYCWFESQALRCQQVAGGTKNTTPLFVDVPIELLVIFAT